MVSLTLTHRCAYIYIFIYIWGGDLANAIVPGVKEIWGPLKNIRLFYFPYELLSKVKLRTAKIS